MVLAVDAADLAWWVFGQGEEAAPFCATAWIAAGVLAAPRYHGLCVFQCWLLLHDVKKRREDHRDESSCL